MARAIEQLKLPIAVARLIDVLERHDVAEAYVFGSYARGTAGPNSDLDLLVAFAPGADVWRFLALQDELNSLPGVRADVVTKLNKHFAPYIEPDLVRVL